MTATCGVDALQNTQNVLCGNGVCTTGLVRLTTPIEVKTSGCEFNLNGRDLSIEKLFDMAGSGFIKVVNAKNISIIGAGKLQRPAISTSRTATSFRGGLIS